MTKNTITTILIGTIIFCSLVGYNYLIAQKKILETRPSDLSINLVSYPETVVADQDGAFVWQINSSPDLVTKRTTIYWGYNSTPSALTTTDSPDAVGYLYTQEDYLQGVFSLPDMFDLAIRFEKTGKIFFRGYAKVGDKHLWTEEKFIEVIPKP